MSFPTSTEVRQRRRTVHRFQITALESVDSRFRFLRPCLINPQSIRRMQFGVDAFEKLVQQGENVSGMEMLVKVAA
jgi:hypothetical protein